MTGAAYATVAAFSALRQRAAATRPVEPAQAPHGMRWRAASGAVCCRCLPVIASTFSRSARDHSTGWCYTQGHTRVSTLRALLLFSKVLSLWFLRALV